jgi:hypothetical protein
MKYPERCVRQTNNNNIEVNRMLRILGGGGITAQQRCGGGPSKNGKGKVNLSLCLIN